MSAELPKPVQRIVSSYPEADVVGVPGHKHLPLTRHVCLELHSVMVGASRFAEFDRLRKVRVTQLRKCLGTR